ncbi:MAG: hypothetical protein M1327_07275 [Candidatus Thermoplasmatota archaeon]|nr:hypothetical protein [Candidatus Thermoplasmatota archaeon]
MILEANVKRRREELADDLISVVNSVMRPNSPKGYRMEDEFPHLPGKDNAENIFYMEDDGKPVSVIAIKVWNAFLDNHKISVASLGSVSTLPNYIHSSQLQRKGICITHSKEHNFPSVCK